MDIQNATAAGPSRGLLDIIFGTGKSAEEAEADGQGFAGLMNFIKAMNGEKSEEQGAVVDRTRQGIPRGKGLVDSQADGTPRGKDAGPELSGQPVPAGNEEAMRKERLDELSAMLGLPVTDMPRAQALPPPVPAGKEGKAPAVAPEQVNASLKQKALPPLNNEELKLLQAVNTKLEQAPKPLEGNALPKEAMPAAGAAAMAGNKKAPGKLADPEPASVAVSGAPEKMVSTESYLQMHESVGKGPVKEALSKGAQAAMNAEAPASAASAKASLTSAAVAGTASKGLELGSRKEREPELPEGRSKIDLASSSTLGAVLTQGAKELSKHDVYLPGLDKPDQFREVLLNDVGTGVALHAHKGGGEMRLVLHPDDMGEVKLKVSTKGGKVEVQLTAENNDVANVLRSGNQDLEASLKDQNLTLSKFEVTVSDSTQVNNLDKGASLNEQFLSQNQQQQGGFGQEAADQGRQARWDTNQGNGRGNNGFAAADQDNERRAPASARPAPRQASRVSSGRLDVVA